MRIAVIGGGIAGLTVTWLLRGNHDVWLYEKHDRVGGHAHTATMRRGDERVPVDTAFVMFNRNTYPTFSRLLDHLGVASRRAPTGFSCRIESRDVQYIYARRRFRAKASAWTRRSHHRMVLDTLRFYRNAPSLQNGRGYPPGVSIGACLERDGYSTEFVFDVLMPVAAALWSLPLAACLDIEAQTFMSSFAEARFLSIGNRHQWRTVTGGSQEYVTRLTASFPDRIRLRTTIQSVVREDTRVRIRDSSGAEDTVDQVVFASHADEALRMLGDPSDLEREILGGIRYYGNTVHLHHDCNLMPKSRAYWATWNYFQNNEDDRHRPVAHTYWMNKLQGIDDGFPTFISLNPFRPPRESLAEGTFYYEHSTLDSAAIKARRALPLIQGKNRTWFCGACYEGGGSHEDALRTGLQVARAFGADLPW
jgi:uncharacterized protein